jgi:hypothetical protein
MTQAGMQARNLDGLVNRVRVMPTACDVEPTEYDGERVRDFMQRAGQIGIADWPARRRKAGWCTRSLHAKTLLCAEIDRQFFPMTKLLSASFQCRRILERTLESEQDAKPHSGS